MRFTAASPAGPCMFRGRLAFVLLADLGVPAAPRAQAEDALPPPAQPANTPEARRLNELWEQGLAAGNATDWYRNRDGGAPFHSTPSRNVPAT